MKAQTGTDILMVPYRGVAEAITDLLGGRIDMFFVGTQIALQHVQTGKLRALAVTGAKRWKGMPDVPTMQEAGLKDFNVVNWFGLWLPAGAPPDLVNRLQGEMVKALADPEVQQQFDTLGPRRRRLEARRFREVRREGIADHAGHRAPHRSATARNADSRDTPRSSPGNGRKRTGAPSSTTCAPAARCGRRAGRTARAARSRCRSIPTTRPTSCAKAASRSASCRRDSTATARACRASSQILAEHDVKASFFVPAVAALLYPDEQRRVVAEGHEIGIHGWIHERNSVLPPAAERDLQMRAADTLERITGVRPVGIRTPSWDFSPHTLAITRDMGLDYDSSLMADVDCYELLMDGEPTGVVELPVEWIRDDAVYFNMNRFAGLRPYTPPTDVLDIFRREFDGAYREGGLFQLTMHPHITGYRSRLWILEELIEHMKGHEGVWFATHADIVAYAKAHAGLSARPAAAPSRAR